MDEDAVVLTSYFRQRHRPGAGSPGRAVIDLYQRRPVTASILLRGIKGHGAGQSPHDDRASLLPKDSPLTAIALVAGPRIDAVLDAAGALTQTGLVALERVRLLSGEIEPLRLGESSTEATRLTIYCGPADRVYRVPAFEKACEVLYRREIPGATVLRGVDGTVREWRHRPQFLHAAGAPLMVIAVGSGDQIALALPELGGLFRHPLMTMATVRLCKRDGQFISRPETLPDADMWEGAVGMASRLKLTVYTSEAARIEGQPAHRAIVRGLRSAGISGATSHRGIWGFHGDRAPHGDHFSVRGRHLPVVTTAIDTPERVAAAFDVIDTLTPGRGLVTAEAVLTPQSVGVSTDLGH